MLEAAGLRVGTDVRCRYYGHHERAARAVLLGEVDACGVRDIVGARFADRGLRLLAVSDPIPNFPLVVGPDGAPSACVGTWCACWSRSRLPTPAARRTVAGWDEELAGGFALPAADVFDRVRVTGDSHRRPARAGAPRRPSSCAVRWSAEDDPPRPPHEVLPLLEHPDRGDHGPGRDVRRAPRATDPVRGHRQPWPQRHRGPVDPHHRCPAVRGARPGHGDGPDRQLHQRDHRAEQGPGSLRHRCRRCRGRDTQQPVGPHGPAVHAGPAARQRRLAGAGRDPHLVLGRACPRDPHAAEHLVEVLGIPRRRVLARPDRAAGREHRQAGDGGSPAPHARQLDPHRPVRRDADPTDPQPVPVDQARRQGRPYRACPGAPG